MKTLLKILYVLILSVSFGGMSYASGLSEESKEEGVGSSTTAVVPVGSVNLDITQFMDELLRRDLLSKMAGRSDLFKSLYGVENFMPTGAMIAYAGTAAPQGWLFCDGREVGVDQYPALFNTIGRTWGPGNGATTFQVPDLRGRTPVGDDAMDTLKGNAGRITVASPAVALGGTGGEEKHTLTLAEMPAHRHAHYTGTGERTCNSGYTANRPSA